VIDMASRSLDARGGSQMPVTGSSTLAGGCARLDQRGPLITIASFVVAHDAGTTTASQEKAIDPDQHSVDAGAAGRPHRDRR
jgi:hypothetical protein